MSAITTNRVYLIKNQWWNTQKHRHKERDKIRMQAIKLLKYYLLILSSQILHCILFSYFNLIFFFSFFSCRNYRNMNSVNEEKKILPINCMFSSGWLSFKRRMTIAQSPQISDQIAQIGRKSRFTRKFWRLTIHKFYFTKWNMHLNISIASYFVNNWLKCE